MPIGTWPKLKTLKMVGLYERYALYDGAEALSLGALVRGEFFFGFWLLAFAVTFISTLARLKRLSVSTHSPYIFGLCWLVVSG